MTAPLEDPAFEELTQQLLRPLLGDGAHRYLSTGCLHGEHDYCQAMTGQQGEKRPGRCKFCDAHCVCPCHDEAVA